MKRERQSWDRQRGEPKDAYIHFLAYLNSGFTRTLHSAYQEFIKNSPGHEATERNGTQSACAPGNWTGESSKYHWIDRARDYDIHQLAKHSEETVIRFIHTVNQLAEKAAVGITQHSPDSWEEVLNTIKVLAGFISNETIQKLQSRKSLPSKPDQPPRPRFRRVG